ncbi:MAG: response regulator [Pseudohongiellaceae bacterium]|nr:response regulator [Pseudohongiellaceae bacterium]
MKTPVLICDDSRLARKQMARSLPKDWNIELSFAENGKEAIEAIRAGKGDILFLDLNMPVMNGYEVLDEIRSNDLPTMALVVSGDIQADAYDRVIKKGALDFIKKPVNTESIREVLARFGVVSEIEDENSTAETKAIEVPGEDIGFAESLQEVVNVAMGRAGGRLAELLETFIQLPVPQVHLCRYNEIPSRLEYGEKSHFSGVTHGFCGTGVAGEAVLLLDSATFPPLIELLDNDSGTPRQQELAVLVDLSGLLIGACLQGISDQLDLDLNHSFPVVLGRDASVSELLGQRNAMSEVITVEVNYQLFEEQLQCHLLLLMTSDSIDCLRDRMELIQ